MIQGNLEFHKGAYNPGCNLDFTSEERSKTKSYPFHLNPQVLAVTNKTKNKFPKGKRNNNIIENEQIFICHMFNSQSREQLQ